MKGFQKKYLRGLAHHLEPVVRVGKEGVSAGVLEAVQHALLDHELIKVRMREPEDKKAMARALAEGSGSELVGLIGHTAILYKRHPDEPRIEVPER